MDQNSLSLTTRYMPLKMFFTSETLSAICAKNHILHLTLVVCVFSFIAISIEWGFDSDSNDQRLLISQAYLKHIVLSAAGDFMLDRVSKHLQASAKDKAQI